MNMQAAQLIADALKDLARSARLIAHGDTFGPGASPTGLEMVAMALGHTAMGEMRRSVTDSIDSVAEQLERVADKLDGIEDALSTMVKRSPGEPNSGDE